MAFSPRLVFSEITLKVQRFLDPELALYALPQRDIIRNQGDIYATAEFFPEKYRGQFLGWYEGYRKQVLTPKPHGPGLTEDDLMVIFNRIIDRILLLTRQPYSFESRHQQLEPCESCSYDYYEFGQEYVKPLIDFDNSWLRNPQHWNTAKQALERGENVILLANHQSETDAGFIPLFFANSSPDWQKFGKSVYYVAGDRVVSDSLAQPFSMGRSLFCVHSKKYIESELDKEVRVAKTKQNKRTLLEMSKALKQGGMLIWVAPNGGRDRLKENGRPTPADWDPAVVELFRSLGERAPVRTRLFPMAMATYSIMPPPDGRKKSLGEERVTQFSGTGLSLGPEVDLSADAPWRASKADAKEALCQHVFEQVCDEYDHIEKVMVDFRPEGAPHVPANSVQPWVAGSLP